MNCDLVNSFQADYALFINNGYFTTEDTLLINGRGGLPKSPDLDVPLQTYTVEKGYRYRFRLINAGIQFCMLSLSIDGHNLTVIANDGTPLEPFEVESIVSLGGDTYDFVVNANQDERDYWIKLRAEGECGDLMLAQRAILRYSRTNLTLNELKSSMPFTFNDSLRHGLVSEMST